MFNLHTHTYRCHHAKGTDEEYVIKAIENGYDLIGFSDHAPYLFPNGYVSSFRMLPSDAQNYADSIKELREKYKGKIDIKLGFEYVDNEYEDYAIYSDSPTKSPAVLDKYISQVILGAKSGLFTYIAHPDLINFKGDNKLYIQKMTYMANELKKLDIPLEFNFLGYTDKRNYPNNDFWQIVSEVKNDVVIGLDAHNPNVYDDKKNLERAKKYLKSLNITPLDKIEL